MRTKLVPIIVLIIILAAIGGGLYAYFFDPYLSRYLQARVSDVTEGGAMPAELKDATYLLTPQNGGGIYHAGSLSYDAYRADGSLVVDYAKAGATEASIRWVPTKKVYEVVVGDQVLLSSLANKKSLALSPSGTYLAVAVLNDGAVGIIEDWKMNVIELATGKTTLIPEVATAVFLDDDTLLTLQKDGMYAVPLSAGEATRLVERAFPSPRVVATRSVDGMLVAFSEWSSVSSETAIYNVSKQEEKWTAEKSTSMAGGFGDIALGKEALYGITSNEEGGASLLQFLINPGTANPFSVIRTYKPNVAPAKIVF